MGVPLERAEEGGNKASIFSHHGLYPEDGMTKDLERKQPKGSRAVLKG